MELVQMLIKELLLLGILVGASLTLKSLFGKMRAGRRRPWHAGLSEQEREIADKRVQEAKVTPCGLDQPCIRIKGANAEGVRAGKWSVRVENGDRLVRVSDEATFLMAGEELRIHVRDQQVLKLRWRAEGVFLCGAEEVRLEENVPIMVYERRRGPGPLTDFTITYIA